MSAILYEAKKCVNKACFSFLGQNWLFAHGIASHGNIEDKTHKDKVYDCGRATIAYEGQGDAHNGHEAYHHAHVDGDFQDEIEEDTNTQKASEAGKKRSCDCVPCAKPLPQNCPEPMAMRDCKIW